MRIKLIMTTNRLHHLIFYLVLILFFITANCNEKAVSPGNELSSDITITHLDSLTLASLNRVDDYPFYTMTYYGDYGFSDYVNPGANHSALKKKDILFEKFSQWVESSEIPPNQRAKIDSGINSKIVNLKSKIGVAPASLL